MAAVLCFHSRLGWAKGGFLGVSVFFTLSGFLITSLVTVEHDRIGHVSITGFWARRARRLVPASLLALALASVVAIIVVPDAQRLSVAGDIRSSLFQYANWRFAGQGARYADFSVVPSPVQHYWSLAIEEQFYLVFPLVAAVALRRRKALLAGFFTVVVGLSVWQQLRLHDLDRIYFGTDARAAEIAIGGLLALAYPALRDRALAHRRRWADVLGLAGLVATAVIVLGVPLGRPALYHGGLAAFAVVSACMVLGSVEGPLTQRVLGTWPLVQLGKISYGTYLYHFPLYLLLDEERTHLEGYALLLVRATVAILAAAISYRYVERPIRIGERLSAPTARLAWAGGAVVVLLAGIPVVRSRDDDVHLAFRDVAPVVTTTSSTVAAAGSVTTGTTRTVGPSTTRRPPARPPRVVVVGDSTAAANGAGLEEWGVDSGRLQVVTVSEPGCGILPGIRFKVREGYEFEPHRCDTLFPRAAAAAEDLDADAIVVFMGSVQLADWEYADLEGFHKLGEPEIDARVAASLRTALHQLEAAGRPILWADVPLPMWDLEVFSQVIGSPVPGHGPVTLNDPPRTTRLNEILRAGVPGSPLATLWAYTEGLTGPDGTIPKSIRPDGLHLSEDGVRQVADAWLFDALGAAYRKVVLRQPAGLHPPERMAWSS